MSSTSLCYSETDSLHSEWTEDGDSGCCINFKVEIIDIQTEEIDFLKESFELLKMRREELCGKIVDVVSTLEEAQIVFGRVEEDVSNQCQKATKNFGMLVLDGIERFLLRIPSPPSTELMVRRLKCLHLRYGVSQQLVMDAFEVSMPVMLAEALEQRNRMKDEPSEEVVVNVWSKFIRHISQHLKGDEFL